MLDEREDYMYLFNTIVVVFNTIVIIGNVIMLNFTIMLYFIHEMHSLVVNLQHKNFKK